MVAVDAGFPRSPRGALKLGRMLVAFVAFVCFVASRAHEAYAALVIIEFIIPLLFFLLYLLKLDKKMTKLYWPLADIFNSVVSAAFLLIVCLFVVIIKTNEVTLAGGKISISGPRERNGSAK
nr:chemokine-like factor isoform X2 [Anas platyrhynchos]|eukprot:XP_027322565.1 chemokine-like factor isoform X2 [Anas platyrhynchos]